MNMQNIKNASNNTIKITVMLGFFASAVLAPAKTEAAYDEYSSGATSTEECTCAKTYRRVWDPGTKTIRTKITEPGKKDVWKSGPKPRR
ncbi:MAG: hypothetical protein ACI4QA_06355 [Candidatus Spyradosoma sp.]